MDNHNLVDEEMATMQTEKEKKEKGKENKKSEEIQLVDLLLDEEFVAMQGSSRDQKKNKETKTFLDDRTEMQEEGNEGGERSLEMLQEEEEEDEEKIAVPLTSTDHGSVLACILIGLFIEGNYPPEWYEQSEELEQLLMNMRKEHI